MAKKRKTLPKEFQELIEAGDVEGLKAIFDRCELNAYQAGYNKDTALFFPGLPEAFVRWLVEEGLDINDRNQVKSTPLHEQARSEKGNVALYLELGADINAVNNWNETPLYKAAVHFQPENVRILLKNGAKHSIKTKIDQTMPLEAMLSGCTNAHISRVAEIAELFINAGVQMNENMKKSVKRIGETFEFYRRDFNKEYLEETENGLARLYALFDVPPAPRRRIHDGCSPITVTAKTWQSQHSELWNFLVPGCGKAQTVQGEVIRISGRLSHEILDNGSMNWDSDFRKMVKALLEHFREGTPLGAKDLEKASALAKTVSKGEGEKEVEQLSELAVRWVMQNPIPIQLKQADYER